MDSKTREVSEFDQEIQDALLRRGWKLEDEMTTSQAFDEYCAWHGLINWGQTLRRVMSSLQELD